MSVSTKTLQIKNLFSAVSFKPGDNLLDTLNAKKISIAQSCEGNGTCTTCRVFVLAGLKNCGPRTEIEIERALERSFREDERLACQTTINDNLEIEILNSEPVN